MALVNDAADRDAHFLDFSQAGFRVGSGRSALLKNWFNARREALFRLANACGQFHNVQDRNVELLAANRDIEAHRIVVT